MRKGIIYVYFNRAKYEKEGIEKYYVGQTIETMEQRAGKDGRGYRIFDETCNSKFARSIRKWGWNAFEGKVLEEVDEEDLNELEKFYIKYFDSYKNGYNTTLGGEGIRGYNPYTNKTEKEMKEIKEKMSKSQNKRFKNEEEREKQSIIQKKRYEDKNEREKQSIAQKKRWEDQEYRKKQNIAQKKRWENIEEREKQSIIQKKRYEDKNEIEKISGELNPCAKSVYCNELNIVFSYAKLAAKYCKNVLNSKISSIGSACNGELKSSGRYNDIKLTWNWTENLDKETLNNAEYIDDKCYEEIINGNKKCLENPELKKIQNKRLFSELNYFAKKVYCNELNIIFSYIELAREYCKNVLNIKIGQIGLVCDCKIKSSGKLVDGTKLTWSWIENVDKETLDNAKYIDSKKYEEIINERKKYGIPYELNYYATSVYCDELNIIFSYIELAKKYCKNVLNIKIGQICLACNGKIKYSGTYNGKKLYWSWAKNVDKETLNNAIYIDSKKYEEIINAKNK